MKKIKNGFVITVFIVVLSLCFIGCQYFNRPMLEYLEYWSYTAFVGKHDFDGSYPETGGLVNLPSGKDRVITYYVVNPKNYDLDVSVSFAHDAGIMVDNNTPTDFATVEQDALDKSIIRLTLNNSVGATGILPLDGDGTDISPTLTITEPGSGRNFGSYTVPVRVNSPPPAISNAVIMKYTDTTDKYAVCFNLPAMGSTDIHRDITQITVNGTFNDQPFNQTYQVNGGGTGSITVPGTGSASGDFTEIDPSFADTGTTFVGVKTGLDVSQSFSWGTCTITLTDSSGLDSVTPPIRSGVEVKYTLPDGRETFGAFAQALTVQATTITLLQDITPTTTTGFSWPISFDWTCTLDLNGYTIDSGLSTAPAAPDGSVIKIVGGTLTIKDSSATNSDGTGGTGKITGGNSSGSGGGINIENNSSSSLTLESGNISGNISDGLGGGVHIGAGCFFTMKGGNIDSNKVTASSGGGVAVNFSGTFIMSGGIITGNTTTNNGGGVDIGDNGTFTMTGGTISGNTATQNGGGVNLGISGAKMTLEGGTISGNTATMNGGGVGVSAGNFTMSGGTISGNTATQNGGGVYVSNSGRFDIGTSTAVSSPVVSGNTKTDSSPNNVYLDTGNTLFINGILKKTEGAGNMGISMTTPGVFTAGWSNSGSTDTTFFFSDDTQYNVEVTTVNDNEEFQLTQK